MQRSKHATQRDVEARIAHVDYHVWPGVPRVTCLVVLENGFSLTADCLSASRIPAEYNEESAKRKARHNAVEQLVRLESYLRADSDWRFRQRIENREMHTALLDG